MGLNHFRKCLRIFAFFFATSEYQSIMAYTRVLGYSQVALDSNIQINR